MTTSFESEVLRIASLERVTAPEIVVRERVPGMAAAAPSGRRILVDLQVLGWPEPAQRWLAGHEMWHAIAHGWRHPGRWLVMGVTLTCAAVIIAAAWLLTWAAAVVTGLVGLAWVAGTAWWSRQLEAEADRYAAADGRLDSLDDASLLELLSSDANVPRWLLTHDRWAERLAVQPDRFPPPLSRLRSQIECAQAELTATDGTRWGGPHTLIVVRRLAKNRLAVGRWPATVAVSRDALLVPAAVLHPHLHRALIASRRLPRVRALIAAFVLSVGLPAAAALAAGLVPQRTGPVTVICGAALLLVGAFEGWRRWTDRRLEARLGGSR